MAEALKQAKSIVLTTHVRPDGDALGSTAALWRAAAGAGKRARVVLLDAIPQRYGYLLADAAPAPAEQFDDLAERADLIVVVDTCAFGQLGPIDSALRARRAKVAVIDHHATADTVGARIWQDTSAAAAGVMIAELLDDLGWRIDANMAEALLAAIAMDTGWFRHANTDARALSAAARLVAAGVEPDRLYARLYQADRPQRLALLAAALRSLELSCNGRLAIISLTAEDFARTGARADETEDVVNEGLRIATVEVSAILIPTSDMGTRISLRSRGAVDVAAIAASFGGGGHVRAAGFKDRGDPRDAKRRLVAACADALARAAC